MQLIKSESILWHEDIKYYQKRFVKVITGSIAFSLDNPSDLMHERDFNVLWERVAPAQALDDLYPKTLSEVLVLGSYVAPDVLVSGSALVSIKVGTIDKTLQVFPKRYWYPAARFGEFRAYAPDAFVADVALDWAHAYGGALNPQGLGFVQSHAQLYDEARRVALPLVEDPHCLLQSPFDQVVPVNFAPLPLSHPLRWRYVDTSSWARAYPKIPDDINVLYFQQALPDQCQPDPFLPGQAVSIVGMSHSGLLQTSLPKIVVRMFTQHEGEGLKELATRCDTLWLLPNDHVGVLIFRALDEVLDWNANDVKSLMLCLDQADALHEFAFYRDAFVKLNGVDGHLYRALAYGLDVGADVSDAPLLESVQKSALIRRAFQKKAATMMDAKPALSVLPSLDFRGQNLMQVNFSGVDLAGADFTEARLSKVSFIGANLQGAKFLQAELEQVNFSKCDLSNARFSFAQIQGGSFNLCLFKDFDFCHARIGQSQFFQCRWQGVKALNLSMQQCILSEGFFEEVGFQYALFQKVQAHQQQFLQVDFSFSRSERCGFLGEQALFQNCQWLHCVWMDANFLQARFLDCVFQQSQFEKTSFLASRIEQSRFVDVDLNVNEFNDARLKQVGFERCQFNGALWQGALLDQVLFDGCFGVDVLMARVVG